MSMAKKTLSFLAGPKREVPQVQMPNAKSDPYLIRTRDSLHLARSKNHPYNKYILDLSMIQRFQPQDTF